jgi:uncharacterized membrane protein YraQ (UPF0718 family)
MSESLSVFSAIVAAIFLEAMPFLAIGALLSAVIEVFVPAERLIGCLPKGRGAGIALGVTAGMVLPTCECGVVPVVRRLIRKGVPPHVAVAYMLSAPIINPVVLASTWFAFRGSPKMLVGRVLVAGGIAAVMALIAGRMGDILLPSPGDNEEDRVDQNPGHAHAPAAGCCHSEAGPMGIGGKLLEVLRHGAHEFIDMGRFLILGAVAAGLFKTFLPQAVLSAFTSSPMVQIVGMMILAVLLSVCSEADAFVAASFPSFSAASQLAFVTIGPMIDLKLIGMYAATFQRRFFVVLMVGPTLLVFASSVLFEVIL